MEAIINLSAISEKMCIDLVREIIDNTTSAIVHFKGKDEDDKDFVKVIDVQNSKQVTAMIHVAFGSLSEIVVDADDKAKEKSTARTATSKPKKADVETEYEYKPPVDILQYFKKDIKRIRAEETDQEKYPIIFADKILGVTEESKNFERIVEILRKLTVLRDEKEFPTSKRIKEIIGASDYNAFYSAARYHYAALKIEVFEFGPRTVKLYLDLYKE